MAQERPHVDVTESPDLLRLAEEIAATGESKVLVRDGRALAIIQPVDPAPEAARARRTGARSDDSLLAIIGSLDEGEPTDIEHLKDRYIADAIDVDTP